MDNNNNQNQLQIELNPSVAQGSYSNLAVISHSKSEFVIDFATMLPGLNKAVVGNRIVMTPEHAKRLLAALQDNMQKYESQFGAINLGGNGRTFNLNDFIQNNGTKS